MDDDVVKLLTEIRDNQREQITLAREQHALSKELRDFNNRAVKESVRLGRLSVRRQMIGIVIVLVFVAIVVIALVFKP